MIHKILSVFIEKHYLSSSVKLFPVTVTCYLIFPLRVPFHLVILDIPFSRMSISLPVIFIFLFLVLPMHFHREAKRLKAQMDSLDSTLCD